MFYRKKSNQYIREGNQFVIEGVTYPSVWLNQSTPQQKLDLGLEEVIATNSPYDPVYYWTGETLDGAKLTYTGTPKDLSIVKENAIVQINEATYSMLLSSDWMAAKAFETGTPIPTEWSTWRASIRSTSQQFVQDINDATNVDSVANVMNNISWPSPPGA